MKPYDDHEILLAEDCEDDIRLMLVAFQRAGLLNPVRVVKNGDDVVDYLSSLGRFTDQKKYLMPGILLLDLKMPGRHGLEVLEWIATQPHLRQLLIVVLTGHGDNHCISRAYDLGAHSFLVKPINAEDLQNLVKFFKGYWLVASRPLGRAEIA